MFKRVALTIAILVIIAVALTAIVSNWAINPHGLELERLGPKGDEVLPPISVVSNAKNYLLYAKHDKNSYVIHLPLPNEYIHKLNTTSRFTKSYAVSVSFYYPEMNGKFTPDNKNRLSCNGWCDGYMRAFIEPGQNDAQTINVRKLERIYKNIQNNNSLYQFEDLTPEFGLDEHFQIRYPLVERKSNGGKGSTKEYFVKRTVNGSVEYLFECMPYAPSPACSVKFNLASMPELLVDIHYSRNLMMDWERIISSVNSMIASWALAKIETVGKNRL